MKSRNTITLGLMSISIMLLLVLQTLWLKNSYEKAFYDLRRDMNYVFRNTLLGIRDSLLIKNIQPMTVDSLDMIPAEKVQTVSVFKKNSGDSIRVNMKSSSIQLFVKSHGDNDSIVKALQPLARHFKTNAQEGKSFVIRLADDTLKLDTVKIVFTKALEGSHYPTSFFLKHNFAVERLIQSRPGMPPSEGVVKENLPSVFSDTMYLEPVRLNPASRYSASFVNIKTYVLKEIAPQIIFSVLLTCTIIGAFVVLYKSLRTQQRLMELKNDFISNVTHELKTPVATVSVALEALKNFQAMNDPQRTQEYLEIAQNELNRLTLMTDKILKASSFERNGVTVHTEKVNLEKVTSQILESMRLVFEKHQATVSLTKEGFDFTIEGSIEHLTNVVYNLIDNALKYSPDHPLISVTLKDQTQRLVLEIQDHGLGIPAEYQPKIFEKFFRVPTGDVHNIKGYGLGLSYVASVVKEHRGTIDVKSEPGKGSIFKLTFPKVIA